MTAETHGYQPKGETVVDTASLTPPVGGSAVQEPGESLHDYARRKAAELDPAEPQPDEDEDPLITEVRLLRLAVERAADAIETLLPVVDIEKELVDILRRKASNEQTAENRDSTPAGESTRVSESDVLGERQASFDDPDNQ